MKLGIMQPYFFPYIGYWQLLAAVDEYVIYDDVNYIKNGWINRNRILIQGEAHYLTLPLERASSFNLINEIKIKDPQKSFSQLLKTLQIAYGKATFFEPTYDLMDSIFKESSSDSLLSLLFNSHMAICHALNVQTKMFLSSNIRKDTSLKGESKVLEVCRILGADQYFNAIGGKELYSRDSFLNHGVKLSFLHSNDSICYKQFKNQFVPSLSIIDVLMFNGIEKTKLFLNDYLLE